MKLCYRVTNSLENKKVKIKICSSHLADRNTREWKTVWLKVWGYGSSGDLVL